jgi:Holliday junction resolvase
MRRKRALRRHRSRDKGSRCERAIVRALQAGGFAAARVPLSGAAGGRFAGDVLVPLNGRDLTILKAMPVTRDGKVITSIA